MERKDCLVLDDDKDFLNITTLRLESKGLEVEAARTVNEAIEKLKSFVFKTISLDITLKDENAAEVLLYLFQNPETENKKAKVFICSSHVNKEFKDRMERRKILSFSKKTDLEKYYETVATEATESLADQMDRAFEQSIDIDSMVGDLSKFDED